MAPFIKGRWGHGGGSGGGGVQRETDTEERESEGENQPLHIGLTLFPFTTVFATTLVDSDRKEG